MTLLLASLLIIYLIVSISTRYWVTKKLLFHPPFHSQYDFEHEVLDLNGTAAIYLDNPEATYTILYSHANAEDLNSIALFIAPWFKDYNFCAYDYPGYGGCQGQPNEQGVYRSMDNVYRYLVEEKKIPPEKIILYGRSLGSGPTIDCALKHPIGGVILEGAFTSVFSVVTKWPLLGFDLFKNTRKIHRVKSPLLVIHGKEDRIVPFNHGKTLWQKATSKKKLLPLTGCGHNDILFVAPSTWQRAVTDFIAELTPP